MSRLSSILGLVALAAVLAACSGASAAPATPGPSTGSTGESTSITAKDMQFVEKAVTIKAGTAFAIAFDNKDGAPHNIAWSAVCSGTRCAVDGIIASDMKGTITAK